MLSISIFNIICIVLNLLILYFAFKKFLFGRVDEIIKARQEEVDSATSAADIAIEEARASKKEYEEKITLADEEKVRILSDIKKQGYEEYERIVEDARKKGDQIITEAKYTAKVESQRAKEAYSAELKDMVIEAAAKIAASKHNETDDAKLYDKFINEAVTLKNE